MFFASAFDFSLITPVMGDVELSGSEGRKVTDDRFRELTVTTVVVEGGLVALRH